MSKTFKVPINIDVPVGTAPMTITSTTQVANLNASALEGNAASAFAVAARGLPTGGTINQVLKKIDATNYNVTWGDPSSASLAPITFSGDVHTAIADTGFYATTGSGQANAPSASDIWHFLAIFTDANNGVVLAFDRDGSTAMYTERKTGGVWQGWNRIIFSNIGNITGAINEKQATLASASTCDIGAATANLISVTGTTTITAFGTAQAGAERELIFSGALTLTHNATSLILPTSANITTANGDCATFRSLGSGNWKCVKYTKVDGTALVGGGSVSKATSAEVVTGTDDSKYVTPLGLDSKINATLTVSTTAPTSPASGDLWVDTDAVPTTVGMSCGFTLAITPNVSLCSATMVMPCAMTVTDVYVMGRDGTNAAQAPSSSTTFYLYKNGTSLANAAFTAADTQFSSLSYALAAGDKMDVRISAANGLNGILSIAINGVRA